MIIKPKIRGFICTTAHPIGCEAAVMEQIQYAEQHGRIQGPKNVLVIGASTGYGLASRIEAAFGGGAKTIGVFFEKDASDDRCASAGWYNNKAFEKWAHKKDLYAKSVNGDAFSNAVKEQVAELIAQDLGSVDLIVYSLASPRRTHPQSGHVYSSTLKPIGDSYHNKTVDPMRGEVKDITIEPATPEEIEHTVAVMGGEDWEMWMDFLQARNLLSPHVVTLAYTYIGPALTHPIYKNGTIGQAKQDLHNTAYKLNHKLASLNGHAFLSVNKALVTQASAAIPVVPLYISILYKVMKEKGLHEGCIEQMVRLFKTKLYSELPVAADASQLIYLDDLEMRDDVQKTVAEVWPQVTTENLETLTDIQGYRNDFHRLFGFNFPHVDYEADVAL